MSRRTYRKNAHAKGFTLVEVMVGMTLGLLTAVIIMQVFMVFENQKRTTTAVSEAQENGLMTLVQLEQAARSAGSGLTNLAALECTSVHSYLNGISPAPGWPSALGPGAPGVPLAPVVITDGGAGGADTITTVQGADFLGSIAATLTGTMPQPSSELEVSRTLGFADGDLILVSQNGNCTVMQVTHVQTAPAKLQHNPGAGGPYNPPAAFQNDNGWPAYTTGANIISLNSTGFAVNTYRVSNSDLRLTVNSAPEVTIVKDIVSVQAKYGVAPTNAQDVSQWVDATGEWASNALDVAHVKRIKAIKLTVVARSNKKEAGNVTTNFPGDVDISAVPDWQRYRYRVYNTIIPLRNIIWSNL
ncbi:MAG TPA: PilW family protein [Gallionella sp.]|nr:PilW family protein [Gallionella sp.]